MLTVLRQTLRSSFTCTKFQAYPDTFSFPQSNPNFSLCTIFTKQYCLLPNKRPNVIAKHTCLESNDSINQYSKADIRRESIPRHIAICLDGSRRWLRAQGRAALDYKPLFQSKMLFANLCLKWGVETCTSFVIGIGHMTSRSKEANDLLLGQFERFLVDNFENFKRKGVKISIVGETNMLSKSLQATIKQVEDATRYNSSLEFVLPVCYSGQRDVTNATRIISEKVKEGLINPEDVNEDLVEKELSFSCSRPPPDLFIRTGGDLRMGTMLSWQVAHIELFFTGVLAPDFGEDVFVDALRSFQRRDRTFGK